MWQSVSSEESDVPEHTHAVQVEVLLVDAPEACHRSRPVSLAVSSHQQLLLSADGRGSLCPHNVY